MRKPKTLYVEFLGDPFDSVENYKRYCGEEKFEGIGPNAEVIRFVEYKEDTVQVPVELFEETKEFLGEFHADDKGDLVIPGLSYVRAKELFFKLQKAFPKGGE